MCILSQIKKWEIDSFWKLSNGDSKIFQRLAKDFLNSRRILTIVERNECIKYIYEKYNFRLY